MNGRYRTLRKAFAAQTRATGPRIGATISLPGVNWAQNEQTLLLVLRDGCHFCTDSAEFYQRLSKERAAQASTKLVAALPGTVADSRTYLSRLGVPITEVRQVQLGTLGVTGTPTLLLINNQGAVTKSWVGRLRAEQESEGVNAIR